mmetsp:Transcript_2868/g.6418  ORF Transcript_2868/g.6418 Transcript_2868/m.6418 type:complete len:258 (-) Transcript_2868:166-939(-)
MSAVSCTSSGVLLPGNKDTWSSLKTWTTSPPTSRGFVPTARTWTMCCPELCRLESQQGGALKSGEPQQVQQLYESPGPPGGPPGGAPEQREAADRLGGRLLKPPWRPGPYKPSSPQALACDLHGALLSGSKAAKQRWHTGRPPNRFGLSTTVGSEKLRLCGPGRSLLIQMDSTLKTDSLVESRRKLRLPVTPLRPISTSSSFRPVRSLSEASCEALRTESASPSRTSITRTTSTAEPSEPKPWPPRLARTPYPASSR